jgi:hypothetical protein
MHVEVYKCVHVYVRMHVDVYKVFMYMRNEVEK